MNKRNSAIVTALLLVLFGLASCDKKGSSQEEKEAEEQSASANEKGSSDQEDEAKESENSGKNAATQDDKARENMKKAADQVAGAE